MKNLPEQMDLARAKNNWYVITGGPSNGKTTVINILKNLGYRTTLEDARHYIDTLKDKGQTIEEIRINKRKFQLAVLQMQILQEDSLESSDIVFLDRAIPDAAAYYQFLKLDFDQELVDALKNVSYKKVFILDKLPFMKDYARTESEADQLIIHNLIIDVYIKLGFPVVFVPVLPPAERVEFILKNL